MAATSEFVCKGFACPEYADEADRIQDLNAISRTCAAAAALYGASECPVDASLAYASGGSIFAAESEVK